MDDKFTVTQEVSMNDLWEAIWGDDGGGIAYWASAIRKTDGTSISLWKQPDNTPNPQDFTLYDAEENRWHEVTLEDLAKGYQLAVEKKVTHCGNYLVSDLEDPDACTGDTIIQLAIFGEVVYG
jgi:hypothetical protein